MTQASIPPESHEQFVARAIRMFPAEETLHWSRFERAIFNALVGRLIYQHGYARITDQMLADVRREMAVAVRNYRESQIQA